MSVFSPLRKLLSRKPQQPDPPKDLLGTQVHVTTNIKGPLGDAVAKMLMDEIDYYFSIPVVRERMTAKFNELVTGDSCRNRYTYERYVSRGKK